MFLRRIPCSGVCGFQFFSVGDSSLIEVVPASQRNRHEIHVDNRNSVGTIFLVTVDDGVAQWSPSLPWNKDDYVWSEMRITVDMDNNIASAWWRDVEDNSMNCFGDGEWTKIADFPGSIPYTQLTAASFAVRDYARADNFLSGNADIPATCSEVLEMGYGLDSDLNDDCRVDLLDLSQFTAGWLECFDPCDPQCELPLF